jgi:hypothetical protein
MKKRKRIFTGLIVVCATCLLSAASCSQSSPTPIGLTAGRTTAIVIAVVGLISSVIGGLSLRAAPRLRSGNGWAGAIVGLGMGLIAMVLSVVHLGSAGDFGTGGGRAGAIVALVLSLIGTSLGVLALARSRLAD